MALGLDHVHLIVRNVDAAVAWFQEHFGATLDQQVEVQGAPQAYMRLGKDRMLLRARRPTDGEIRDKAGLEYGLDHFGIQVDDVEGTVARMKGRGVTVTVEPRQIDPKTKIAFVKGPDGVLIELMQRA
jgi:catechol 2,3-dioxygenase-like lactoylglutathione lyase family enzyme